MNLTYCSITGADDDIDPLALAELSKTYPFVEWAILWSPSEAGSARFPTEQWIKDFHVACPDAHKAMHLCGDALQGFIEGDSQIQSVMQGFQRIQINLKFMNMIDKVDPELLASRIAQSPAWEFILQYAKTTENVTPYFDGLPNVAYLLDESAGRGVSPHTWPKPIPGRFCGYAGGIGPENISQQLDTISGCVAQDQQTWVDMESKVRTDNRFDLNKVRTVLELVKLHHSTKAVLVKANLYGLSQS